MDDCLVMLKREGIISSWYDRGIEAGQDLDKKIQAAMASADIFLLLVSNDFLNSDYCYEIETSHALERHNQGTACVIPVILRDCEWKHSRFKHLNAVPPDGTPITEYENEDKALLQVATAIREVAKTLASSTSATARQAFAVDRPANRPHGVKASAGSPNTRVKKTFTDSDNDEYLKSSLEVMAEYFQASLQALENDNEHITARFQRVDANSFTAVVYSKGSNVAACTIWSGDQDAYPGGLCYYASETTGRNTYNEVMNIENDGYEQGLSPMGMSAPGMTLPGGPMGQETAAEFYWQLLIKDLQ